MNRSPPSDNDQQLDRLVHDLKNALATIQGRTQLVQRRLQRGEALDGVTLERHLAAIEHAVGRATRRLSELDGGAWRRPDGSTPGAADGAPPPAAPPDRRA
ncbi:MAG TPA: hypothetical protein VGW38_27275 [Chloroflexota bacterium]|nr:hypothetical protein [Chloroflexota bacterium]